MSPPSRADIRGIYHVVEEAIVLDGFLKGAMMDPFDAIFAILGNNPIVRGKPDDWIFGFLPWLLLFVFVAVLLAL